MFQKIYQICSGKANLDKHYNSGKNINTPALSNQGF